MFDPDKYYRTGDKELLQIASFVTLARWRCKGTGPSYIKVGFRVLYHGSALNDWLEKRTVRPERDVVMVG